MAAPNHRYGAHLHENKIKLKGIFKREKAEGRWCLLKRDENGETVGIKSTRAIMAEKRDLINEAIKRYQ